jgi:hypothetical protein
MCKSIEISKPVPPPPHTITVHHYIYREGFYFVGRYHGSVVHGDWCTAGFEVHLNFADESACLITFRIKWSQFTDHRRC